ncbi:MAG: hypothetical protein MJZ35_09175 [Bacteroidaceae bacterium]|nr:hypothetical protein [Bacteroidaceae bacterium]
MSSDEISQTMLDLLIKTRVTDQEDNSKLINCIQELTSLLGGAHEREVALRLELHSAKERCEASEKMQCEYAKRVDRIQAKYDELHDEYVRRVGTIAEKSAKGTSTAKADVKVQL